MDTHVESRLLSFFYIAMATAAINLIVQNLDRFWLMLLLSGIFALLFSIRNILFYSQEGMHTLAYASFAANLAVIYGMGSLALGNTVFFFCLILVCDAVIGTALWFAGVLTASCYFVYFYIGYISTGLIRSIPLQQIGYEVLAFSGVFCLMCLVKYSVGQQGKFKGMMFALKQKTKQLEDAYQKLKKTSGDLEEVTILRERNRIAREIHDTVGHTLTTVLMELEAGERLIPRDPALAREKLGLARSQVRKGLNDIRESVSILKTGREMMGLKASLQLLIEETINHGAVYIHDEIGELPSLTEQQEKALYRALQEGITNGIRHGGSTAFVFQLEYENGTVRFFLQDNGKGTDRIVFGFGLTAMQQRVREAGGEFHISSRLGEGCCIEIRIPAGSVGPAGNRPAAEGGV